MPPRLEPARSRRTAAGAVGSAGAEPTRALRPRASRWRTSRDRSSAQRSALIAPKPREDERWSILPRGERQRRGQVVEIAGRRHHLARSAQSVKRTPSGKGRKHRYRSAPVSNLDRLACLDQAEQLARPLSQLTDSHALHVLFVAQRDDRHTGGSGGAERGRPGTGSNPARHNDVTSGCFETRLGPDPGSARYYFAASSASIRRIE